MLIDAVYEPHDQHCADDFGTTIAGFFSDEPEFGNGSFLLFGNRLGPDQPLPWRSEVVVKLERALGVAWKTKLGFIWENDLDPDETARVRYGYMAVVTRCVEEDFSFQVGDWYRDHGLAYIGHVSEEDNQHARTGSVSGHFFRGLAGQDMAGIDDIPPESARKLPESADFMLWLTN